MRLHFMKNEAVQGELDAFIGVLLSEQRRRYDNAVSEGPIIDAVAMERVIHFTRFRCWGLRASSRS